MKVKKVYQYLTRQIYNLFQEHVEQFDGFFLQIKKGRFLNERPRRRNNLVYYGYSHNSVRI